MNVVYRGTAERAQMPIPPGVIGYDPTYRSGNTYDPELANRLLDRFGYKRGKDGFRTLPDGAPLELVRNSYTGGTARDEELIWQKSMERIGLRIRSEVLTGAENAKRSTTCTTMLFGWNWFADYPDGENFMQLLFGPNSNESNAGCYRSEAYDRLYRQAEALPDGRGAQSPVHRDDSAVGGRYGVGAWRVSKPHRRHAAVGARSQGAPLPVFGPAVRRRQAALASKGIAAARMRRRSDGRGFSIHGGGQIEHG